MTVAWILAAMALLAPAQDHDELALAEAMVRALEHAPPIFDDDDDQRKTAALMIAVAFRESSFRLGAVGDQGRSFCAMQIHVSSGGSRALLEDADSCVRKGLEMLRASARVCPHAPVAHYAFGRATAACSNTYAIRISRDRMAIAARLVRALEKERIEP